MNPDHLSEGTQAENMNDMKQKGRGRSKQGADHHRCKLTEDDVRMIRASLKSNAVLGKELGVAPSTIYFIRSGQTWKHVS